MLLSFALLGFSQLLLNRLRIIKMTELILIILAVPTCFFLFGKMLQSVHDLIESVKND